MDYFVLRSELEKLFKQNNVSELADIDWIMVEVLKKNRSMLPLAKISEEQANQIRKLAQIRAQHIPLAYITGKAAFYGYELEVNSSVLIPRMDTEVLVEQVIGYIKSTNFGSTKPKLLDIGTGSGAIAITTQLETGIDCMAIDVSDGALAIAKRNAENLGAKVKFERSNLFENLSGQRFDIVVSNPPYIESKQIPGLEPEVAANEPILALDGGTDGLKFYREIVRGAIHHLCPGGMLFFEIGYDQAKSVTNLMQKDFENIKVIKDYSGNDRVVFGKLKEKL